MNRIMFILSLVGMAVFAVVLALTIFGQNLIKEFARDYLNHRIEPGVTRIVATIEREVVPRLEKNPSTALRVTNEIVDYRADPIAYIDSFTSGKRTATAAPEAPSTGDELDKKKAGLLDKAKQVMETATKKVRSIGEVISDHFREVFEHLVFDLRIFAISNLVGFAVVAWLTRGLDVRSRRLQIQAYILFLATGYAASVYINQSWFFNLLLDSHMGFWYPLLIVGTCVDLWLRWRRGDLRRGAGAVVDDMIRNVL